MKKWKYKFNQNLKTSMDIGEITPIYWDTLYPGESIKKLNFRSLTRMITPIYPTLDNPKIELYAFAVPKRLIIPETGYVSKQTFENISIGLDQETKKIIKQEPLKEDFINYNAIVPKSNLLMKFGIIELWSNTPRQRKLNINYLLAYWKIYEQFFKQKQIEIFNYTKLYKALTLEGKTDQITAETGNPPSGAKPTAENLKVQEALKVINKIAKGNADNEFLNELTFQQAELPITSNWNTFKRTLSNNYIKNKMIIEQKDFGTIKDNLINVWNANNLDKTNPILLGYEEFEQGIEQVVNQTATGDKDRPLGDIGGMSVNFSQGHLINNYTANEETIIMVLALPTYKMNILSSYEMGEWDPTKIYNPLNEYIQEPRTNEFIGLATQSEDIIGYVPPFNWLRKKKDIIAGEIIDKWSNWTYALNILDEQEVNKKLPEYKEKANIVELKNINTNLLKIRKKPFKDTLISPQQDSFICEYEFHLETLRTIKPYEIIEQETLEGE